MASSQSLSLEAGVRTGTEQHRLRAGQSEHEANGGADECARAPAEQECEAELVGMRTLRHPLTPRRPRASERRADDAIRDFAYRRGTWDALPVGTWRVLLERHLQMLTVLTANAAHGTQVSMTVPRELLESARLGFAVLFWLYRMKLQWPPDDRSAVALPEGAAETYLRPH